MFSALAILLALFQLVSDVADATVDARAREADRCVIDGDAAAAVEHCSRVIALSSFSRSWKAGGLASRAAALNRQGRYDDAIADLDLALRLQPGWADALYERAYAYRARGRKEAAMADLDAVLRANPRHFEALMVRAEIHAEAGDRRRALQDLDAALQIDPGDAGAWGWRGQIHGRAGDDQAAIEDFDAALQRKPGLAWVLIDRAKAYRRLGQPDAALRDLDAAVGAERGNAHALVERGDLRLWRGEDARGIADFSSALAIEPDYLDAVWFRCSALIRVDRAHEAVADCRRAAALAPTNAGVWATFGFAYLSDGAPAEAYAAFNRALVLDAGDALARFGRSLAGAALGKPRPMLDAAAARAQQPDIEDTLQRLGYIR
ncbi:MAG: tetratricopeptide repeat protein [Dongiaceae bacterium]